MPSCYVPGCKSGNNKNQKSHAMKISKNASEEIKLTWLRNIPKQKGKLFDIKNSVLCEKHFEPRFVKKDRKPVMFGSEIMLNTPSKRWYLTDDAVPTIFANDIVPKYFDRKYCPPRTIIRKLPAPSTIVEDKMDSEKENQQPIGEEDESVQYFLKLSISEILQGAQLPTGWFAKVEEASIKLYQLIEDERNNIPTFHASKTIVLTENEPTKVWVRNKIINLNFVYPSSSSELEEIIFKVAELSTCSGFRRYQLFESVPEGHRCGYSWFSNNCSYLSNDDVCNECKNLETEMEKLVRYSSRRRAKPKTSQTLKKIRKPTIMKLISQRVRRQARKIVTFQTALKDMQIKFDNLNTDGIESVINTLSLPVNFKNVLVAATTVAKAKSKFGVRYKSDWILQCLLLKITSAKAYRYLRNNQLLPLPHPDHLIRILRGVPATFGFNRFIFEELKLSFSNLPRTDRQFVILFDEMKIKEAITFEKDKMRFTGYIDYGEFSSEVTPRKGRLEADHALVFMCRCLNSNMTQPLACFATRGAAPGHILAKLIVHCISKLEEVNCEVVGVVCDGATTNKSAWKILNISEQKGLISNKIVNPVDNARNVYFFCDIPHVIKCIRNHLLKVGCAKYRGQVINWGFYSALYDVDCQRDLRVAPKLSRNHVKPNPFQKMVVSYATQVFSNSVADALRFYTEAGHNFFKHSEGTEAFTKVINDLFDACNGRTPLNGITPDSHGFKRIRDFLETLEEGDTFASSITMTSLKVTLTSIVDLTKYLCNEVGFRYVLTAKLNQDCLENFFGLVRSFGGDDSHPTAHSFAHIYRLLSIYAPAAKVLHGNVRVNQDYAVVSFIDSLKSKAKNQKLESSIFSCELENKILEKIVFSQSQEVALKTGEYVEENVIFHLCGYLAFKAKSFSECQVCIRTLCNNSDSLDISKLTSIKDKGGLKYPSEALVRLISEKVEPAIKYVLATAPQSHKLVNEVINQFDRLECANIGCVEEHSLDLIVKIVLFYVTIRMYFFEKNYNKEKLRSTNETKVTMKNAKCK